jgi:hypothetical protein
MSKSVFDFDIEGLRNKKDSDDLADEAERKGNLVKQKTFSKLSRFQNMQFKKIKSLEEFFFIPQKNEECRLITQGSFNMFTILMFFQRKYDIIDELYITTFNIKEIVIDSLFQLLKEKKVKKLRIMVSESIKFRMPKRVEQLIEMTRLFKEDFDVKLKLNWNHSKIMLAKLEDDYYVLEGSGNLSDNAQIEQYVVSNSEEIFNFHKRWMDESFSKNILKREEIHG